MTPEARRRDLRGIATRAALIEQAEKLFAERGVEGVSLREIGVAIGAGNTNVALYHFGSKEALITETIRHRLPAINQRRAELLAMAERQGRPISIDQCLDILFRPLFEQTNAEGRHSYIAFLQSLHRSNNMGLRAGLDEDYPATGQVVALLEKLADLPKAIFLRRLQVVVGMIAWSLRMIDQQQHAKAAQDAAFVEALAMARAALTVHHSFNENKGDVR